MRFHVVGLPHTVASKEFCPCAYTQKVLNFCKMMHSLGHTVYHYGGENSSVECTEHISIISAAQRKTWWGQNDWRKEQFAISWDSNLPYWKEANSNAVREITKRIQPRDFVCLIGGNCQKAIADAFPGHQVVEFGIGYEGVFAKYRIFESYAHMHYIYGKLGVWGSSYDEVIPNYYDEADFPFSAEKDDYFLFVGRLIGSKGIVTAAEMCRKLGARLLVAGQGIASAKPGEIITAEGTHLTGNVEYVGVLDVKRRGELMSKAKALILQTAYIGPFEGVTVEAQMCGTPVITTDWGCFAETVLDGVTGFRCRTLGELVWAGQEVSKLNPETIRDWALKYSINRVRYRYEDYFERLLTLWGQGWYDLSCDGQNKRYGGFGEKNLAVLPLAPEIKERRPLSKTPLEPVLSPVEKARKEPPLVRQYLEIGTCDFSTLNDRFKDRQDWAGTSVEALPEYFDKLPKLSKNRYVNAVCVGEGAPAQVPFFFIPQERIKEHHLPDWLRGCGTLDPDHPFVQDNRVSISNYKEHLERRDLPTIQIRDLLHSNGERQLDLLKLDTEGADYKLLCNILDLGARPTHIIFETCFMSDTEFEYLDGRLRDSGYRYRGREGDNVQYSKPSVLLIVDVGWSTGAIAKDLAALSSWRVDLCNWSTYPAHLPSLLQEYDAVIAFVLHTAYQWGLKDHGVICCNDMTLEPPGRVLIGKCVGAVSPATLRSITKPAYKGGIYLTPGSARLGRFIRQESRPIKTLGWCGTPHNSVAYGGQDLKRYSMFEEIVKATGLSSHVSRQDYGYEDMQLFYDHCDLLLCTSLSEGGPLPVFEAIACGVPVISTDVGLVKDMDTVWKFSTVDEALALINRLKDPEQRAAYCDQQYAQLESKFSMEHFLPNWEEFFRACSVRETNFLDG